MSESFKDYSSAKAHAQKQADEYGYDYGVEKNKLFSTFSVFMLPCKENRYGHELFCETVHPSKPSRTNPGHGFPPPRP